MLPKRPKNLNLFTIHFPLPAIISILHRVSGFILFLIIPFALWMLEYSLTLSGFEVLYRWFGYAWIKLFCLALLIPFCFHLVAGIRHLLMDIHIGDELKSGRASGVVVIAVTILLIIIMGVWLW